jgi:hypothetical protein
MICFGMNTMMLMVGMMNRYLLFVVVDGAMLSAAVGSICGLENPQPCMGAFQLNWKKYLCKSNVKRQKGGILTCACG